MIYSAEEARNATNAATGVDRILNNIFKVIKTSSDAGYNRVTINKTGTKESPFMPNVIVKSVFIKEKLDAIMETLDRLGYGLRTFTNEDDEIIGLTINW